MIVGAVAGGAVLKAFTFFSSSFGITLFECCRLRLRFFEFKIFVASEVRFPAFSRRSFCVEFGDCGGGCGIGMSSLERNLSENN